MLKTSEAGNLDSMMAVNNLLLAISSEDKPKQIVESRMGSKSNTTNKQATESVCQPPKGRALDEVPGVTSGEATIF